MIIVSTKNLEKTNQENKSAAATHLSACDRLFFGVVVVCFYTSQQYFLTKQKSNYIFLEMKNRYFFPLNFTQRW